MAVDLGATNIRAALLDLSELSLSCKIVERTRIGDKPESISNHVIEVVKKITDRCSVSLRDVAGIGVGAAGPLDSDRGRISEGSNFPYSSIPVREPLEEEFGKPVELLNDANAAALGELFFGVGKSMNARYIVYITFSSGIGGGVIDDGKLVTGVDGNAGEIGCITVDYRGEMRCGCGRYGHWQAYSSGKGIPAYVRRLFEKGEVEIDEDSLLYRASDGLRNVSAEILYNSARRGDKPALEIVERINAINAVGVGSVINVYNPEVISLGGAITLKNRELAYERLLPRIRDHATVRIPEIVVTSLGEDVVLYGAAAAILQRLQG